MNPTVQTSAPDFPRDMRPRLLLISYWYPPAVGAAAERMHSFARYLPTHGWDVRVLTAQHEKASSADANVTAVVDPWQRKEGAIADYDPRKSGGFSQRLRGLMRDFVFPDRFRHWQRAAFDRGLPLVRDWKPDVMLASFPPASAVELALRLHEATGVRLVLDYRDKWLGPGGYEPRLQTTINKHLQLERRATSKAAGITAVSDALIAHLRDDFNVAADRTAVILNGFEATNPPSVNTSNDNSTIRRNIAHVGTVIPRNRPERFFSTLIKMMNEYWGETDTPSDPDPFNGFRFRFVGNLSAEYLKDVHLNDWVTTTGLVPRDAARAEMFNADALLLLSGDYVGKWGYSVKLFEYLQTGRPILCLEESPGSNDARLLQSLAPERAFIGRLGDAALLAEQLAALRTYLAKPSSPVALPDKLSQFDRKTQAARLDEFLRKAISRKP